MVLLPGTAGKGRELLTLTQHLCPSTGLDSRDWYPQNVVLDRGFQPPRSTSLMESEEGDRQL